MEPPFIAVKTHIGIHAPTYGIQGQEVWGIYGPADETGERPAVTIRDQSLWFSDLCLGSPKIINQEG